MGEIRIAPRLFQSLLSDYTSKVEEVPGAVSIGKLTPEQQTLAEEIWANFNAGDAEYRKLRDEERKQ